METIIVTDTPPKRSIIAEYRPITTAFWALVMLLLMAASIYAIFVVRGGPIEYLRARPISWPLIVAGYAVILFGVWIYCAMLWQVLFCGRAAVWLQGGRLGTQLRSVRLDEIEHVCLANNVGSGIFSSNALELRLKSGRKWYIATNLLVGAPQDILGRVRQAIRAQ